MAQVVSTPKVVLHSLTNGVLMNTHCTKPISTFLVVSALSLLTYGEANAQQKPHQEKHVSSSPSSNQVKNTEWHLVTAILNDNTEEIKQAAQKQELSKKENKKEILVKQTPSKNKETAQAKTNKTQEVKQQKQSFFKVVRVKVVCVVSTLVATGSKIKNSVLGYFRG